MIIAIAIIQTIGVFLASTYGLSVLVNMWRVKNFANAHVFFFGVGMAMATCGMFFNSTQQRYAKTRTHRHSANVVRNAHHP